MTVNNLSYKQPINEESGSTGNKEEMRQMLEENKKMLQEILKNSKKMNHFIISQQVFGFLKLLVIIVPLVLGYLYLTPLLKDALAQYQEILSMTEEAKSMSDQLEKVNPDILKKFIK